MKVVDALWVGRIGFIKVTNGFELKVYAGLVQGMGEAADTQYIIKNGSELPLVILSQFLEGDPFTAQYVEG